MPRILILFACLTLLLCACTPAPAATEDPFVEAEIPTETPAPVELTAAQRAAFEALSETPGITSSRITLISTEPVEWPDGCLGIAEEGIACTEAITPGYRILLESDGRQVEYRTNEDGTQVRPATVLMTWRREGGIAGFCDSMTVYLSGEVHVNSCRQGQTADSHLSAHLSRADMAKLDAWYNEYGNIQIDASDPKGVADRMIVTLTWHGSGTEEALSEADQQELLLLAQEVHQQSSLPLR